MRAYLPANDGRKFEALMKTNTPSGNIPRRALVAALTLMASLGLHAPVSAEPILALTTSNTLFSFDSATPGAGSLIAVTGLIGGDALLAIDVRPATGDLYALSSGSRLYSINEATGAATQIGADGSFTLMGTAFGFDFNPVVDRIRVTSDTDQNLRLNPNNGTLTATDAALNYASGDPFFGFNPESAGSAYANNFSGAMSTTLFGIDALVDQLVIQNPPNSGVLNTVGPLGVNTSALLGFDISGTTGTAYAALNTPGSLTSGFYVINLSTGAATLVGSIGPGGFNVRDIAAPVGTTAVPEPGTLALMSMGIAGLLRRRLRRVR
jgi:Domain of unknown function (DUF4394)/PEP-CTERM motif